MKKIIVSLFLLISLFSFSGIFKKGNDVVNTISKEEIKQQKIEEKNQKKFVKKMESYELEATISTTKGDINVYLYPEAAPLTVASFVNLSKNNFYDGLKFHRVITNVLAQGGDPEGDGTGSAGYTIKDEISDWLKFSDPGMLAMANSGPNTNGSQFFITMSGLPQLNGKYTVFGELKSREDLSILKLIRQDDIIIDIQIKGRKVDEFLSNFKDNIDSWNNEIQQNGGKKWFIQLH